MSPIVLQHRTPIHRADEDGREYHPMVERRLEHERREQAHRGGAGNELDERLHGASVATLWHQSFLNRPVLCHAGVYGEWEDM